MSQFVVSLIRWTGLLHLPQWLVNQSNLNATAKYFLRLQLVNSVVMFDCYVRHSLNCIWPLSFRSDSSRLFWTSHDAENPEERPNCTLHRARRLSVLACAGAQRYQIIHLWADPSISEGQPLHHRWIQSLPPLQTVHQKVRMREENQGLAGFQYIRQKYTAA